MKKPRIRQLELPLEFRAREIVSQFHIVLDGKPIPYTVRRSRRRRSFTLTIDDRGLRVGVPWHASARAIEGELHRHGTWIVRKLKQWTERRAPRLRWADGEAVMLLGEPLRLTLDSQCGAIVRAGDRLVVGPPLSRPEEVARQVVSWLRDEALRCFHSRIPHYASQLDVRIPDIRLSEARTRWGSCHPSGRVHLNWRLIQMPLRLLDYVVVHELAHLREMNHSPRFWRIVERIIPDYTERRREIRTDGLRYLIA